MINRVVACVEKEEVTLFGSLRIRSTHQTLKLFSQVLRDNPCTREIGMGSCPEKLDLDMKNS